jgi:hypothetical protein
MSDYTGLADNPLEHDPVADAITAGGTERSRPSPRSSPRRSITNGIDYQGLRVGDLIKHVENTPSAAPTLKEATAIVRASHKFVERSDASCCRAST